MDPYCRRLHVDHMITTDDETVAAWSAVPTGRHTMRKVRVVRVERWMVETVDQYDPTQVDVYESEEDALAGAEETMGEPDSRGIYRAWVVDDGSPRGEPSMGPGAWLGGPKG
jgi:hypothetical protein